MAYLFRVLAFASLLLSTASPSFAGEVDSKLKSFKGDNAPANCNEQKVKQGYFIYRMCKVKGKPVYVQIDSTEASEGDENGSLDVATLEYRNGKLVQVNTVDFQRYGFRDGQLVAAWDMNKFTNNVSSSKYRNEQKRWLNESRKIFRLFNIK